MQIKRIRKLALLTPLLAFSNAHADSMPAQAIPPDLSTWKHGTPPWTSIQNKATVNGQEYTIKFDSGHDSGALHPLWGVIFNGHTYEFSHGGGSTSHGIEMIDGQMISNSFDWYYHTNSDGNTEIAKVVKTTNFKITYVYSTTSDGLMQHAFYIENISNTTQTPNFKSKDQDNEVTLDTMLDADDHIPLIADGHGGAYIKSDITLYLQPLWGVSIYGNKYNQSKSEGKSFEGQAAETNVINGIDSQIDYHFNIQPLQPGQTMAYGFREGLYPDGMNPALNGIVRTSYVDSEGRDLAPAESKIMKQGDHYETQAKDIPGYEIIAQPENASGTVGFGKTEVVYRYQKARRTVNVQYINNDQVVKTVSLTGIVGENMAIPDNMPDGYHATGSVPTNYTVTDEQNQTIQIPVGPNTTRITEPGGDIHEDDLKRTVSRTITFNEPGKTPRTITQQATFTRTGTRNEITKEITWDPWTTRDNTHFDAVAIPQYEGYRANYTDLPAEDVTADSQSQICTVYYTHKPAYAYVRLVTKTGEVIKTLSAMGGTGETINTDWEVPDHYKIVSGQLPKQIALKQDGTNTWCADVVIDHEMQTVLGDVQADKEVTRTVIINNPVAGKQIITAKAYATQTVEKDLVTGQIIHKNDWHQKLSLPMTLPVVSVPKIPGYQAQISGNPDKVIIDGQTSDYTVTIDYVPNNVTVTQPIVDENGNKITDLTVTGKVNNQVSTGWLLPNGYTIVSGYLPSSITMPANDQTLKPIVVGYAEQILPNQAKTVTRTINIHRPGKAVQTITQIAHFTRSVKKDLQTGQEIYGDWMSSDNQFSYVTVPQVAGYRPSIAEVPAETVNANTENSTIDVTYVNGQDHITSQRFVDSRGQVIATVTASGKTNETITPNWSVPRGWKIIKGQIPKSVTINNYDEQLPDIEIAHNIIPAGPGQFGITDQDVHRVITRTIIDKSPLAPQTVVQKVEYRRQASFDEALNLPIFTPWRAVYLNEFPAYHPVISPGYKASTGVIDRMRVIPETHNTTIEIDYEREARVDPVKTNVDVNKLKEVIQKAEAIKNGDKYAKLVPKSQSDLADALRQGYEALTGNQNQVDKATQKFQDTIDNLRAKPGMYSMTSEPAKFTGSHNLISTPEKFTGFHSLTSTPKTFTSNLQKLLNLLKQK